MKAIHTIKLILVGFAVFALTIQTKANDEKAKQASDTSAHLIKFSQDTVRKQYYNFDNETYTVYPQYQKRTKKRNRYFRGHWAGGYAGLNSYVTKDFNLDLEEDQQFMEIDNSKSWNFAVNFAQYSIPIVGKYVGVVLGLGAEWNNYSFKYNNTITVNKETGLVESLPIDSTICGKNRLQSMYITSGALLEFHIPGNYGQHMSISGGIVGGMRTYANTSYKIKSGSDEDKIREGDDFNLQDFNYYYTVRIGFDIVGAYFNYSAMPLFKKHTGPELYPLSVGLVLFID